MYNLYTSERNQIRLKEKIFSQAKLRKQKRKHKEEVEERYKQYQNRVIVFLKSMDKSGLMKNNRNIINDNPHWKEERNNNQVENMLFKLSSEIKDSKTNQPMRFTARSNVERLLESLNLSDQESQAIIKKHLKLLRLSHSIGKADICYGKYNKSSNNDGASMDEEDNDENMPHGYTESISKSGGLTLPNIDWHQLIKYINKDAKKIKASYHDKTYFKGIQTIAGSCSSNNMHNNLSKKNIFSMERDILDEIRDYNDHNNDDGGLLAKRNSSPVKVSPLNPIRLDSYNNSLNKNTEIFRKTIMHQLSKIAFIKCDDTQKKRERAIENIRLLPKVGLKDVAIEILTQHNICHKKIASTSKEQTQNDDTNCKEGHSFNTKRFAIKWIQPGNNIYI